MSTASRALEASLLCETVDPEPNERVAASIVSEAGQHLLILRELQHRMANTLAILQANCRLGFAGVEDLKLKEYLRQHERRLAQLAEFHHFLSRGVGHGPIVAAVYFQALCSVLCRAILAPMGLHCDAFIGDGVLDARSCELLGLIVTELVLNAAKHGFPNGSEGRVRVDICAPDGMVWCCTVRDNGCGMRRGPAGAGSQIVNGLVQMLDGRMLIDSGTSGTTVTILFPPRVTQTERLFGGTARRPSPISHLPSPTVISTSGPERVK